MDISFEKYIIDNEENLKFKVDYYHYPDRWQCIEIHDTIKSKDKWSVEMKYLSQNGTEPSSEVKNIPDNLGGIYVFFIKGIILPFIESYPVYIGRAKNTPSQNLRKRCLDYYYEYFKKDSRMKIERMIRKWGNYLYIKYIELTDNDLIIETEAKLINCILPPFNDRIPKISFQEPTEAFN